MNGMDPGPDAAPSGEPVTESDENAKALGRLFADARELRGLAQEEVAKRLYLSPDLIRHIDAGELGNLPKPAYLKGYLRAYARLVGISGDEAIARYDAIERDETTHSVHLQPVTEEEVGSAKLTGPVATTGLWGLGAVVVILLLVWGFSGESEHAQPVAQSDAPAPSMPSADELATMQDATDAIAMPGYETAPDSTGAVSAAADTGGGEEASHGTVYSGDEVSIEIAGEESEWRTLDERGLDDGMTAAGDAPVEPAFVTEPTAEDVTSDAVGEAGEGASIAVDRRSENGHTYVTVRAGGEDHLNFTFSGDCWIEVTADIGGVLYEDLHHEGDVIDLYAEAPFRVLAGRAQAVAIRFNDEPVRLIPNMTNNTAKVELGS